MLPRDASRRWLSTKLLSVRRGAGSRMPALRSPPPTNAFELAQAASAFEVDVASEPREASDSRVRVPPTSSRSSSSACGVKVEGRGRELGSKLRQTMKASIDQLGSKQQQR